MTYKEMWQRIAPLYGADEARSIAKLVFDRSLEMSLTDICVGKDNELSDKERHLTEEITSRLEKNEPVQYVLGSETFCGRDFSVGSGVLIPRPETERLAALTAECCREMQHAPSILDIGTGSGCLAVTAALDIEGAEVTAWDISAQALDIARKNAARLKADVRFELCDALNPPADARRWNIIVSNPPYVTERESKDMRPNVLDYEPATALFVPDDNPTLFYRAIARYAARSLKPGGWLLFEANPLFISQTVETVKESGLKHVETIDDMCGKRRFMKCSM